MLLERPESNPLHCIAEETHPAVKTLFKLRCLTVRKSSNFIRVAFYNHDVKLNSVAHRGCRLLDLDRDVCGKCILVNGSIKTAPLCLVGRILI